MIYFLQSMESANDGPVKIGYTEDPDLKTRVSTLQTGNPYPLRVLGVIAAGTYETESEIHKLFSLNRMCGEWFECSFSLERFIRAHSRGYAWGLQDRGINPWRAQFAADVSTLRQQGKTLREIGDALGINAASVCNILKDLKAGLYDQVLVK